MAQLARHFSMVVEDWELACRYLVHDRDTNFAALDGVLKNDELRIPTASPGEVEREGVLGGLFNHYFVPKTIHRP